MTDGIGDPSIFHPEFSSRSKPETGAMINTKAVNDWLQQNTVFPIVDHFLFVLA
jgi:hypothetical protein